MGVKSFEICHCVDGSLISDVSNVGSIIAVVFDSFCLADEGPLPLTQLRSVVLLNV